MQHYNTVEILIDNPVLAEIMQKYKELGAFEDEDSDPVNDSSVHFSSENAWTDCPVSLKDVLEYWSYLLESEPYISDDFIDDFKDELKRREEEINRAYGHVKWETMEIHGISYRLWRFQYDPQDGESYEEEQEGEDEDFERDW